MTNIPIPPADTYIDVLRSRMRINSEYSICLALCSDYDSPFLYLQFTSVHGLGKRKLKINVSNYGIVMIICNLCVAYMRLDFIAYNSVYTLKFNPQL